MEMLFLAQVVIQHNIKTLLLPDWSQMVQQWDSVFGRGRVFAVSSRRGYLE